MKLENFYEATKLLITVLLWESLENLRIVIVQCYLYLCFAIIVKNNQAPQNGQTHSNNSSTNNRRIIWVCLIICEVGV